MLDEAPARKTVAVAGGFKEPTEVKYKSATNVDVNGMKVNHEEADTRIILHCVNMDVECIVVSARDTDVLLLLIAHFDKLVADKVWMKAGTSKKPKYIPIHEIHRIMSKEMVDTLLAFHSITGCDTVCQLKGVYSQHLMQYNTK